MTSKTPILVVMAAGMGSRYGGLKQIDPLGPSGELIIDYSLYDAFQAGFRKVVFIIKAENREVFDEVLTAHLPEALEAVFCYQELADLPEGFSVPPGREKPWGTAHAVYSARTAIDAPFVVINADDFYGRRAFQMMFDYLSDETLGESDYAMVGYRLRNTVTENGSVSRGVCEIRDGFLTSVQEYTEIYATATSGRYLPSPKSDYVEFPEETYVSMNFWGFRSGFLQAIEGGFERFMAQKAAVDPLKAEYYLPTVVMDQLASGDARVRVLKTADQWIGVTYREDRAAVRSALKALADTGEYPSPLWR